MKKCSKCVKTKPLCEFSINKTHKDGRSYRCKECQREYSCNYYKQNKEKHIKAVAKVNKKKDKALKAWVNKFKEVPCADCNRRFPSCAMDFDHVKGEKEFTISAAVRRKFNRKRILKEIQKCEVVCANCHRVRTKDRIHENKSRDT